ncbi:MAG: hypothetical protein HOP29_09380 [Phycisphaerales bacterium]|nr:hypothetical protein [Phycisphaerales bacterium]
MDRASNSIPIREHAPATALCLVFAAVPIIVPLVQLPADRPARFGWQMYSGIKIIPQFEVIGADGGMRPITLTDFVANVRADLRYDDVLPKHLCRVLDDAAAVRARDPMTRRETVIECPR